ncbi:MAG TPA: DsbA family protein [Candidatus Thermoplasmatota archaeon]|nr:DsbA family protein [Candidatus Thermoplasmatota archaeon]
MTRLLYVFDAYCGWCWGFREAVEGFAAAHPDLPMDVVSGGLFVGERRRPLRSMTFIPEANARLTQMTGATFGPGYEALLGTDFTPDSTGAAAGFAALRAQAPARALELAGRVQAAFFRDGLSLHDAGTFRRVAREAGLDASRVPDPLDPALAATDFDLARRLGVGGFPTLALVDGDRGWLLARGAAPRADLEARLATARRAAQENAA